MAEEQDMVDGEGDQELIKKLRERISELEARVEELESEKNSSVTVSASDYDEDVDYDATSDGKPAQEAQIYVTDIARGVSDEELKQGFEKAYSVHGARVVRHKATGESKGFGFVQFFKVEDARMTLAAPNTWPSFTDKVTGQTKKVKVFRMDPKDTLQISKIPRTMCSKEVKDLIEEKLQGSNIKVASMQLGAGGAVVKFRTHDHALQALRALNGCEVGEQTLHCAVVDKKHPLDPLTNPVHVLFVKNIPQGISKDALQQRLNASKCVIPNDTRTGQPLGHAFVHFSSHELADAAMEQFQGCSLGGKSLSLEFCVPQGVMKARTFDGRGDMGMPRASPGFQYPGGGRGGYGAHIPVSPAGYYTPQQAANYYAQYAQAASNAGAVAATMQPYGSPSASASGGQGGGYAAAAQHAAQQSPYQGHYPDAAAYPSNRSAATTPRSAQSQRFHPY